MMHFNPPKQTSMWVSSSQSIIVNMCEKEITKKHANDQINKQHETILQK